MPEWALSGNPAAREKQLANLQAPPEEVRAGPDNKRRVTHGALSSDVGLAQAADEADAIGGLVFGPPKTDQ